MITQKPLQVSYKSDEYWFPQIGPQLKATFDENQLTFDNSIGKGLFYRVVIEPGLHLFKAEATFHKPVVFTQQSASGKGFYILASNLSDQFVKALTGEREYKLGYGSENGIYFCSPLLTISYVFKPGYHYHLIFIGLSHERISSFINRQPDNQQPLLKSIIDKKKPIYHVEYLDMQFMAIIKDIDKDMHGERMNNLLLHSRALELCHHLLLRVEQRRGKGRGQKIHPDDIARLNEIRRALLDGYQEACPPLEEAARKAAMSPTKFKSLFKEVFGHTYYQFYKNVRMHKARELLEQQKMNVSEVGYLLGYQNLSKFTKAFRTVFSMAPSSLVNS